MTFLQVHPEDDLLVALEDHRHGESVSQNGHAFQLLDDVPAKQKVSLRDFQVGDVIRMYGIIVAQASEAIRKGQLLTTANAVHATEGVKDVTAAQSWQPPDISRWRDRTFAGYVRDDSRVGTRNYWIVVPLVFCENRNLRVMREAMVEELGYATGGSYRQYTRRLIEMIDAGKSVDEIMETVPTSDRETTRVFPNIDGIKFLAHNMGCGEGDDDSSNLCGLLAGYINHPNVAGATVLSLGCQNAQIAELESQLHKRNPSFKKPLLIFEQQQIGTEQSLLTKAISHTLAGLADANRLTREEAPLSDWSAAAPTGFRASAPIPPSAISVIWWLRWAAWSCCQNFRSWPAARTT